MSASAAYEGWVRHRRFGTQRLDYPWHNTVLALQRNVLGRLFHPVTLARVQDNELGSAMIGDRYGLAFCQRGITSVFLLKFTGCNAG